MQQLEQILNFLIENKELFATLFVTLLTILKLTSWGRSESAALDAVIEAVERVDDKKVKRQVAARQAHLNTAVQDALDYAVSKVDPLDVASDIKGQRARIEITDLCRQFLRLEAWQDREKIHLQSSDKTRSRWQKILLDTTKGREKLHLWGLGGGQEVLIDSTAGAEMIRVTDKAGQVLVLHAARKRIEARDVAGSRMVLDGARGNVIVRSAKKVLINP